jgi:uroporphyrinogen-III synthase
MRRLFIFRPEPAARQTIAKARALGLDAVSIPLFELEGLDWSPPEPHHFDAILLTSANAVRMAGGALNRYRLLPVYALGEGTAAAARGAGFSVAKVGSGGIDQLLAEVPQSMRLLHLCGAHRRQPSVNEHSITTVPVYRAVERAEVRDLDDCTGQVAVLHSPRAASRLADLVHRDDRATIRIAAISEATGEAAGEGWEEVRATIRPLDSELLALAARLCET